MRRNLIKQLWLNGDTVDVTRTVRRIGWGFQFGTFGLYWDFMRDAATKMLTSVQQRLGEEK